MLLSYYALKLINQNALRLFLLFAKIEYLLTQMPSCQGPLIISVRKYWIFDPLLFSCGSHRPDPSSKLRSHPSPSYCNFSFDKQKAIVTLKSRRQDEIILWNTADYYMAIQRVCNFL